MSVNIAELDDETRARVLAQIGGVTETLAAAVGQDTKKADGMSATLTVIEPQKICGSHKDREERSQRLASLFIREMVPLLVQVRQDFLDKRPDETICGVRTFTDYCTNILQYSEGYIRQLIRGQNPASSKHDGSANRKPKADNNKPADVPKPQPPEGQAAVISGPRSPATSSRSRSAWVFTEWTAGVDESLCDISKGVVTCSKELFAGIQQEGSGSSTLQTAPMIEQSIFTFVM